MNLRIALFAVVASAISATTAAAAPATAQATATANIVAPANLVNQRALQFGTLAKPTPAAGASTFTVASTAAATQTPAETGPGNGFAPIPNQAFAAQFRITATPAQTYSVTQNALTFDNATGNLTNVGSESPVPDTGALGTVPAGGIQDLYVGGHLTIDNNTAVATYNGTLTLTVDFQ